MSRFFPATIGLHDVGTLPGKGKRLAHTNCPKTRDDAYNPFLTDGGEDTGVLCWLCNNALTEDAAAFIRSNGRAIDTPGPQLWWILDNG